MIIVDSMNYSGRRKVVGEIGSMRYISSRSKA